MKCIQLTEYFRKFNLQKKKKKSLKKTSDNSFSNIIFSENFCEKNYGFHEFIIQLHRTNYISF